MPPEKISKNRYRGVSIRDIVELAVLADDKRAVYIKTPYSGYIKPASWVMCWQANTVLHLISVSAIYYCVKEDEL